MLLKRQTEMANYLTVKQLIDMEFALMQLQTQVEKLPLVYEWQFRVFLYKTMPYMATYKGLATRLLEKRYGKQEEVPMKPVKGKKQKPAKIWVLDPERKDEYEKELKTLHEQIVPEEYPQFDERILIMNNVSVDVEKLKPIIIPKDVQAVNN